MIIECINCNKKFNVNSDLIPDNGSTLCGESYWTGVERDVTGCTMKNKTAFNGEILKTIVEEYTSYATPVPSSLIRNRHGFSISSATIRNEMAVLEDAGYISRKHSSGGCLPTAKGYRHYVETVSSFDT